MKNSETYYALSIVVPVYRSATILPLLVEKIQQEMREANLLDSFELVLVNDASPDNSWQVICALAAQYPFVKGITLRRNFGQHNATMAGLNHAVGDIIVVMDDDLQHPPEAINRMIYALNEGYDVCYTCYLNRKHATWKKLGSAFNNWVATHLLGKPKGLYLSSFKAIRKEVVTEIIKYDGPYAYLDGLILDVTRAITTVEIEHQERHEGQGNYNLRRSLSLWLKMATSFSVIPLRFTSLMGLFFSGLGLLLAILLIIQKFTLNLMPIGWSSLIVTILVMGGAQLLALGMIGEYLGRVLLTINSRPQYVIAETVGLKSLSKLNKMSSI